MSSASEGDKVLKDLAALRPKIERMELTRRELYDKQNELYLKGDSVGLNAAQMARAMRPDGNIEYLAESIRHKLRTNRTSPNGKKKARTAS